MQKTPELKQQCIYDSCSSTKSEVSMYAVNYYPELGQKIVNISHLLSRAAKADKVYSEVKSRY